jgi:hypothetical protein
MRYGHGSNVPKEETHQVAEPVVDPEEYLQQLKDEHRVLRWAPLPPDNARRSIKNDQALNKSSLDYLHQHWALPDSFDPVAAGGGTRGKIVGLFGRLTYRVLGPYFREERGLLSHMVRINEALEQRCIELTLFCEQLNQDMIDRQVAEAENQTKLAILLDVEAPSIAQSGSDRRSPGTSGGTSSRS